MSDGLDPFLCCDLGSGILKELELAVLWGDAGDRIDGHEAAIDRVPEAAVRSGLLDIPDGDIGTIGDLVGDLGIPARSGTHRQRLLPR